ncbi:MAG: ATP-dependent helicase [Phycisphaerales bacterium]
MSDLDQHASQSDPFLEGLTPPQQQATLHEEGPLLVLAGPGSGKTRVITRRIARLVAIGVPAWQILAVTFTNKAAGEMRARVGSILGEDPAKRGLTVATFHSLCVRLLRRWSELAGSEGVNLVKPGFVVYDADDQAALMKKVVAELNLSTANWPPRTVLGHISNAKNQLMGAEAFAAEATDFYGRTIARVYEAYERKLRAANAVDFDDLLLMTARMLKESAAVRSAVQGRYRYLMVDEYQDTNHAQLVIANLIAGEEGAAGGGPGGKAGGLPNICVVGDPDQSIYGWRGADIANILEFEKHYPSAQVIALGENFRSLEPILAAADRLIQQNKQRKHKPLIAVRGDGREGTKARRHEGTEAGKQGKADGTSAPPGAPPGQGDVQIVLCRDEHHEAALVVDWLKARRDAEGSEGSAWKDMAVFFRTNALSRVIEEALRREAIPYVLVRGTAFYDREEVRSAMAYLRVIANPADGVSLGRIINTPARGIGGTTLERVEANAEARGLTLIDGLREAALPNGALGFSARASGAIAKFVEQLDSWREGAGVRAGVGGAEPAKFMGQSLAAVAAEGSLPELVERVIRESGLEKMYASEDERAENLAEVVSSAREFEEAYQPDVDGAPTAPAPPSAPPTLGELLSAYLERVALVADTDAIDQTQGAVMLMTLHAAKGLEFRCVAMIGLEEGLLPHSRSHESESALEEERRLCFVGVTRAMDDLHITSAAYRTIRGVPERAIASRFLEELAGPGVRTSDQSDSMGVARPGAFGAREGDEGMRAYLAGGSRGLGGAGGGSGSRGGGLSGAAFAPGQRVRHPQFGEGVVEQLSPGADARVRVKFRGIGTKTLVLAYARLERMG